MRLGVLSRLTGQLGRSLATGASRPIMCNVYLSFRCNMHCAYCGFPDLAGPELPVSVWLEIVDQLAELGCCRITVLGGEPLLFPGLEAVIERTRRRGIGCVVASNGLRVEPDIDRLALADTLVLSLDAFGRDNDTVRAKGSWKAVTSAVRAARSRGLATKINTVVTSETISGMPELLDFVAREDLGITVNLARSGSTGYWNEAARVCPGNEQARSLFAALVDESRRNPRLLLSPQTYSRAAAWHDYSVDYLDASGKIPPDFNRSHWPRCQAGRFYFSILPDGSVSPCSIRIGRADSSVNAAHRGVKEAWRSLLRHRCLACYSPCLMELNQLFSFDKRTLLHFASKHLFRVT